MLIRTGWINTSLTALVPAVESLTWEKTVGYDHNANIKIRPVNFSTEHKICYPTYVP